jgi:hypothetical protein
LSNQDPNHTGTIYQQFKGIWEKNFNIL